MAPRLKVLLPADGSAYPPTRTFPVNAPTPTPLHTPGFTGSIAVWVKDYHGEERHGDGHEYFGERGREGNTYAIVVRGRFGKEVEVDDVMFGNVFERPIRESLPWGTAVAVKFMHFVDPTMEQDIYADKPWALSPLMATVNYLSLTKSPSSTSTTVSEASASVIREAASDPPAEWEDDSAAGVAARRKYLGRKENRQGLKIGPDVEVGIEFANGLLDFNTLSVSLPPPFTLHIPLTKYWDGQPVTYVCKSRSTGEVFWSVAFQIVDTGEGGEGDGADKPAKGRVEEERNEAEEATYRMSQGMD